MARPAPEEPLAESAPLAHRLAREHCPVDGSTGESCAWYHGFWQFMRLIGVAKTSGGHVDFLAAALGAAARSGRYPRVLISGSADYSMPAHAFWAYREAGAELELSCVDRCGTPLALTRWYGSRYGMPVTTHLSDVAAFESVYPYDVVTTNSFLGYFDPPARARLFARWAGLLRPGGRLIITNRIRPGEGHAPVGFTEEQARTFVQTVRTEALRLQALLPLEPDAMARLAQAYAERFQSVPVRSCEEVTALLESSGFSLDRLDTAPAAGRPGGAPIAGPTLAEPTDYVRVVAIRC